MGFNISGAAIGKNLDGKLEELEQILGLKLQLEKEVTFEEASSNWTEKRDCFVYYSEKGTLVFLNFELAANEFVSSDGSTLGFALSETSMTFIFNYFQNGTENRFIMAAEGEIHEEHGSPTSIESKQDDISDGDLSELIWNQIEAIIGKPFWDIDLSEKAYHYSLEPMKTSISSRENTINNSNTDSQKPSIEQIAEGSPVKPKFNWRIIGKLIIVGYLIYKVVDRYILN